MQKLLIAVIMICMPWMMILAQDDILFTVDSMPVFLEEFESVYHKNKNLPGYEHMPVADYLDMYVNFKLKVLEAERMGYDTQQTFIDELAGYREQLAVPYLCDQQVVDRLVMDAYERTLNEVNASHILMILPENPAPGDTLRVYNNMMDARKRIINGEAFADVAVETSEDPYVVINQGNLGWFYAFAMVFPFEEAAYKTDVGDVSLPVRTSYGYHLIQVNGKRKALGEIKLAHIMVHSGMDADEETNREAEEKIYRLYDLIRQGQDFGETALQHSEDSKTADNRGQMPWIRSGDLPPDIEDQVFMLHDRASYTQPLRSIYGWHIFQLLDRRPLDSFENMQTRIREMVLADNIRMQLSERSVIKKIKEQSGFIQYAQNIGYLLEVLDSSVYSGQWDQFVAGNLTKPVFEIGGKAFLQKDLAEFIAAGRYLKSESLQDLLSRKSEAFIHNALLEYKKSRLEDDHPEFRDLMKEYYDGILLFNISDDLIWHQAVQDSAGLLKFYEAHKSDYMWKERAEISVYSVHDVTVLNQVRKLAKRRYARKWPAQDMTDRICGNDSSGCMVIEDVILERGTDPMIDRLKWKKGTVQEIQQQDHIQIIAINNIIPPEPRAFNEIRGMIVADYQDYLEQQWVSELRAKYPVVVNKQILEKIDSGY